MSPIRVVKISELRRPTRNKESVVEHLEEFHAAKLKLHSGLKPQEAIEISIPKSTERGRKHLRASFKKRIRAYLSSLGLLEKYAVNTWADGDNEYITIVHKPVMPTMSAPGKKGKKRGSRA
jgi:hypothetical protein